jgi:hypothetical protein
MLLDIFSALGTLLKYGLYIFFIGIFILAVVNAIIEKKENKDKNKK